MQVHAVWMQAAVLVSVLATSVLAQRQFPFQAADVAASTLSDTPPSAGDRAGRFLHVTDMHPDQFYTTGAKINDACHAPSNGVEIEEKRKKKKKKKKAKRAGYWGAEVSVCDSPQHLITSTLDWLADNWITAPDEQIGKSTSGFDFVIWTGDTARHDIDFTHPRNAEEIFQYNRWALEQFETKFANTVIVPNVGNNDIIPHNIMFPGPNSMTKAFRDIWAAHIPADQHDAFLEGAYFTREVIEDDLAVLSLNTLYWYDANAATRGCKKASEPGSIELDWMEQQLHSLRNRSMQAHLMGHVPPTAGNYFAACYDRYTDIVLRFQDTIVGQHFGHMNIDAMFLQEDFLIAGTEGRTEEGDDGRAHLQSLSADLRKDYDLVPTQQKTNLDAYLPFFVGPSVVPTYFPTVRVWTYNNTRPLQRYTGRHVEASGPVNDALSEEQGEDEDEDERIAHDATASPLSRSHRRPRQHKKHRKGRRGNAPRHTSPDSPSRRNGYLTMLGYSQWVLDLPRHNKQHEKHRKENTTARVEYELEYTTYDEATLWSDYLEQSIVNRADHVHRAVPKLLLDRELTRRKSKAPKLQSSGARTAMLKHRIVVPRELRHLTDYRLPSMTIEHVMEWARELAGDASLWERFRARIYAESGATD